MEKMRRQIGDERAVVGDFSFSFVFNRPGIGQMSWLNDHTNTAVFQFPNTFRQDSGQEWSKLEKLPEGTVTEAALSFDRMFTTDELLQQFKNKNMTPVWFAADTGLEKTSEESIVWNPVGFPYRPVWHHDDIRITSYKEQKSGWFGKIVTKGGSYPAIDTYGSGELRNENFMKTLRLLQDYRSITKNISAFVTNRSSDPVPGNERCQALRSCSYRTDQRNIKAQAGAMGSQHSRG